MSESDSVMKLNGKFTYILFHNETNFYTVSRFLINDESEKMIIVTGLLPDIHLDELYDITGHYVEHPRYGMQFVIDTYSKQAPNDRDSIIRYLSSVQFAGVGRKSAEKVVDVLGKDCLNILKEDPTAIRTVPGLSDKAAASIEEHIHDEDEGMEQLIQFLNIHGIGIKNLIRLHKAYGNQALEKLKENPYRVIDECDGMGFKTADKIGEALGIDKDDERRLYAYLVALVMKMSMDSGDSYVNVNDLKEMWHKKTVSFDDRFDEIVDEAVLKGSLYRKDDRVYAKSQYEAEVNIAAYLKDFPYVEMEPCDMSIMHGYLKDMEKDVGIQYDELQKQAIDSFFEKPFSIITGGPGTGKTTVVRAMMKLFRMMYPNATSMCVAPTGRAAKRLNEVTGTDSTTIHSFLKWDLETNSFGKNEEEPVDVDLLIIDEFSMVDSFLFSSLVKAGKNIRKICLLGDEDQLPSVGPGCVLRDLIASEMFPLVRLNHIYRQKSGSEVISLAHDIRKGNVNFDQYHEDVQFYECSETEIRNRIIEAVSFYEKRNYTMEDIQVLSPMYAGSAGIDVLNNALQEVFNPHETGKKEVKAGYRIFREGDKILQLKNQPDDDVYNGDIGNIVEIVDASSSEDHKTTICVSYQDNIVEYKPENFDKITHAYCISVHKSQGGEYPVVIMPFVRRHTIMLQKRLIYTACTRAKKKLILLGDKSVFERGIQSQDRHIRNTTLVERLKESSDIF